MRYTLFAILFGMMVWAVYPKQPKVSTVHGHAMGVEWSIKVRGDETFGLKEEVGGLLERLEQQMSNYRETSALSRFNDSRGTSWVQVPKELSEVVERARSVSEMTDGAFDITVAPLVDTWGFGPKGGRGTPAEDASAPKSLVGYEQLKIRPGGLRKTREGVRIDLGGIGKGFAADKVGETLDWRGVKEYLVAIGGELRAKGTWRVGIEAPSGDGRVLKVLDLKDASMSTSGDYRNFFDFGGKRYSHEIEPRSGRPVEGPLASVTVIHPKGTEADGLATGLFVMGPDAGFQRAEDLQVAAVFVTRGGERDYLVKETSAFRREWGGGGGR